jgi:hypothetical protein
MFLLCFWVAQATAAERAERVLPKTTKGFISIPDVDVLLERWNVTNLGKLTNDPLMRPFVADLEAQLRGRLLPMKDRLGIEITDLRGIPSGEVSLALTQPGGVASEHAIVLLLDVSGQESLARARQLLRTVQAELAVRGATRRVEAAAAGVQLEIYRIGQDEDAHDAVYYIHNDLLVATDHRAAAEAMIARIEGRQDDSLATLVAYKQIKQRTAKADRESHIRWFVEPFGYVAAARASQGGRRRRGTDISKVLAIQGFDAVQGVGGTLNLADEGLDIVHRTLIYAPRDERAEMGEKYRLAARMLEFKNSNDMQPMPWVPAELSTHLTLRWNLSKAFESSKTLVNEILGDEVFETILHNIETDPKGPQINIRKDLIAHLGDRITFFAANKLPITPQSEQFVAAVEVKNAAAVKKAVEKALTADPNTKRHVIGDVVILEMTQEAMDEPELPELIIDDPFGPAELQFEVPEQGGQNAAMLPQFSVTVVHGHLLVSNQVEYLKQIATRPAKAQLAAARDFVAVQKALAKLGSTADAIRFFARSDEAYHVTYQLIKDGRMPEAESMFGQLLNHVMPAEEGPRKQQIDGEKMPEFNAIRKYLTPAGFFVQSIDDGWLVTGCLMSQR